MAQAPDTEEQSAAPADAARRQVLSATSNAGAAIYGLIIVSVLLAAESARRETYLKTVLAVLLTLVLYWLAHSYADLVSWQVREGRRLTMASFVWTMVHEVPLLAGAAVPLVTVLLAWVLGSALQNALLIALWVDVGAIVAVQIVAGVRAELSGSELLGQVVVGAALGVLILVLRLALH